MVTVKVKLLNTFPQKAKGLLGEKRAFPVLFKTRFGIHTFGLTFPIDVLILDKKLCIMKLAQNLQPMQIFLWPPSYDTVVELPEGYIKEHKLKIGDIVQVKNMI